MVFKRDLEDLIKDLRENKVSDKVLEAFRVIKREFFVENKDLAYLNQALPFLGQTTSQPLVIANVLDNLDLDKEKIVLEVGIGSGFQTCLLAYFSKKVYSFEIDNQIYLKAKENIQNFMQISKISLDIELYRLDIFKSKKVIDKILEKYNKIDRVVFSFAIKKIPDFILKNSEIIIAPIDEGSEFQKLKKIIIQKEGIVVKDLGYVSFVKERRER